MLAYIRYYIVSIKDKICSDIDSVKCEIGDTAAQEHKMIEPARTYRFWEYHELMLGCPQS